MNSKDNLYWVQTTPSLWKFIMKVPYILPFTNRVAASNLSGISPKTHSPCARLLPILSARRLAFTSSHLQRSVGMVHMERVRCKSSSNTILIITTSTSRATTNNSCARWRSLIFSSTMPTVKADTSFSKTRPTNFSPSIMEFVSMKKTNCEPYYGISLGKRFLWIYCTVSLSAAACSATSSRISAQRKFLLFANVPNPFVKKGPSHVSPGIDVPCLGLRYKQVEMGTTQSEPIPTSFYLAASATRSSNLLTPC